MELNATQKLASYVDALRPIIYIHSFDFQAVDSLISAASKGFTIYEYNEADKYVDFATKVQKQAYGLIEFLALLDTNEAKKAFIILKDVHQQLNNPEIIARLKSLALKTIYKDEVYVTVFLVNTTLVIPVELEAMITVFDIPLPNHTDILATIHHYALGFNLDLSEAVLNELAVSFKGLSDFEIRQILNLAYQESGTIDGNDKWLF